jgi:iduronate 2-sulfatase
MKIMKKTSGCIVILLYYLFSPLFIQAQAQNKPNVIFIGVDDLGIAMDAYGNPEVPTPNLSRLMQHGTMFKQVYCQYALCSPSRTSILSGKRPNSTGVINNGTDIRTRLGTNYKFLPEYFDNNGYYTGKFGKMTCGHEEEIAWDYVYDSVAGDGTHDIGGEVHWWVDTVNKTIMQTRYGQFVGAMLNKMNEPRSAPYFYGLGLATHNEFAPILSSWNKIGDNSTQQLLPIDINGTLTNVYGNGSANITLPNTPLNDGDDIPSVALKGLTPYPADEWKNIRHAYYGEISEMDDLLGVVIDELDSKNAWDNTVVVFWSDHGIQTGEHNGLWFKQTLFEGCLRVPLIICAPGKVAGGVHNSPVEMVDLYSTLAELCGLPKPAGQEGSSLVPLLEKPNILWKKAAFAQVRRVDRQGNSDTTLADAVRTTQYHYNSWGIEGEELYDIVNDPDEFTNLVGNVAYAVILDSMRSLFAGGWQSALPPAYVKRTCYRDADGDKFGTRSDSVIAYFAPLGYVLKPGDCDDTKSYVNPGAKERSCNGIDDNCDGVIDENKVLPTITVSGSPDICATGYVNLESSGGAGGIYQWKRNGTDITGATKKSYRARAAGAYSVVVTNPNSGCAAESLPTTVTNSCGLIAANSMSASSDAVTPVVKFSVYPNPSRGNIAVSYNGGNTGNVILKVYDVMGRLVYSKKQAALKAGNLYNLDLSKLSSGVYYLEAGDIDVSRRIKFIIER